MRLTESILVFGLTITSVTLTDTDELLHYFTNWQLFPLSPFTLSDPYLSPPHPALIDHTRLRIPSPPLFLLPPSLDPFKYFTPSPIWDHLPGGKDNPQPPSGTRRACSGRGCSSQYIEDIVWSKNYERSVKEYPSKQNTSYYGYELDDVDPPGPPKWATLFPSCGDNLQSPIDIPLRKVRQLPGGQRLIMDGYATRPRSETVRNTGHYAEVNLQYSQDDVPVVHSGSLKNGYVFNNFHMHWGASDRRGSEHTIDGEPSSAEVHLVHYNDQYDSVGEARNTSSGILVIGVLVQALDIPCDSPLDTIAECADSIHTPGTTCEISPFPIGALIPDRTDFFVYGGSLTTPPCSQSVLWFVAKRRLCISRKNLNKLRQMMNEQGGQERTSFRPVQPLNDRPIFVMQN